MMTPDRKMFWVLFASFTFWRGATTFNLDVRLQSVKKGPSSGSYFGYSLAVHRQGNQLRLLVGSPGESQFAGAAYVCQLTDYVIDCVLLYPQANAIRKSRSWLGATVTSLNSSVMICAPRASDEVKMVQGECFITDGVNVGRIALRQSDFYFCQLGFSVIHAQLRDGSSTLFMGSPTCSKRWGDGVDGGAFSIRNPSATSRLRSESFFGGSLDPFYQAYSMATDNKDLLLISIGFHDHSSFAGKVYWLSLASETVLGSLEGEQPGEHFGASMAMADMNNDGLDDLIVGAPHHSDFNSSEFRYEIGAVYVFHQQASSSPEGRFVRHGSDYLVLKGQSSGGRFGFSVATSVDFNADGYNDLAVGAPYDSESGTVFIYLGSKDGLRVLPSQVISGRSFNVATFGFSLTVADFDANQYGDLIVGAYQSDSVIYLPGRPVIRVASELYFSPAAIIVEKNKNCTLLAAAESAESTKVACAEITSCSSYTGVGAPDTIQLQINITAIDGDVSDSRDQQKRILFLDTNDTQTSRQVHLKANKWQCWGTTYFINPEVQDRFVSSVRAEMSIRLVDTTAKVFPHLVPILDSDSLVITAKNNLTISGVEVKQVSLSTLEWWIYLLCVLGAVTVMAVITGVLYKLGFFKRKLPPTQQDDQTKTDDTADDGQVQS